MIERRRLSINRFHLTRLVLKTLLFFRAHHSHTFISSSIIWRAEWYYARIENESLTIATITYLFDILSFNILISNTFYISLQKMSSNELCFRKFFTQMTSTKLILSIAFLSFIISKCRIATSDRILLSRLSTMTLRTRIEKSRRYAKALHAQWKSISQCMKLSKRRWETLTCLRNRWLFTRLRRDCIQFSQTSTHASNRIHQTYLLREESRFWQNWFTRLTTTQSNIKESEKNSTKTFNQTQNKRNSKMSRLQIKENLLARQ